MKTIKLSQKKITMVDNKSGIKGIYWSKKSKNLKYICLTCDYLERTGGRPNPSRPYIFDNYGDYEIHHQEENAPAPGFEYLVDNQGKCHLSCTLVAIPNHKSCPAHPKYV